MNEFYMSLTSFEKVFAICAALGGTIFVIRTVMLFVGLAGGAGDIGEDGAPEAGLGDTDVSFHFLTLHGITAFFLMFGVVGLTLSRQHALSHWIALGGGSGAGLATMLLIAWLFAILRRLQSDGTLRLSRAVGQEGTVYLRIQPGGIGKVRITIQGGLKIFEACARDAGAALQTGDRVRVVEVTPDSRLIVERM